MPLPDFVRAVVPVAFWIAPLKVVEVLSPPAVSVAPVALLLVTVPAPASDPTDTLNPAKSSIPVTVVAEFDPKAVIDPAFNVPADTVVAPV